nr:TraM recognition domain-containing protein [Teredinibacter turnerae]
MPLLAFSKTDFFTLRNAFTGVGIFGATGSGKTSGSGQTLARSYLTHNMGGLVLCAKKSEAAQWLEWAKQEGREKSIIHVTPEKNIVFDFLGYEMRRATYGTVENCLNLFNRVIEITTKSDLSQGENAYFYQACQKLLRNAITLCHLAYGKITLRDVYEVIISAPKDEQEKKSEQWMESSACFKALTLCNKREKRKRRLQKHPQTNQELVLCAQYFLEEYPAFGDRLRSSITSIFTACADPWMRDDLWKLFGRDRDTVDPKTGKKPFYLDPDLCKQGAIILFDFPVKESYTGRLAQALYKYMWQQHMERRDVEKDGGRPVFLWADEAQLFVLPEADAEFAQTARSSRIATVLLSQNLSNYYVAMGQGEHGKNQTESLMGNLGTLIFHCNSHEITNRWASTIAGNEWRYTASTTSGGSSGFSSSESGSSSNDGTSNSMSVSETLRTILEPREFTLLATGGKEFNYQVEAIVMQAGRVWNATASNYIHATFDQRN